MKAKNIGLDFTIRLLQVSLLQEGIFRMWEKIKSILIEGKTTIYSVVILIALISATPALADYLGPNRTVTEMTGTCKVILYECKYVPSKSDWRYRVSDSWSCSNESKPWQGYDSTGPACEAWSSGRTYWAREETLQEVTNTYPPATISSTLQNCTENNGWCLSSPQLSLNATEPLLGYSIVAIEGSLNGQTFACLNSSCNVPLNEGDNAVNYWALSSWGDSSTMGTLTVKVDSQLPNINGSLSGMSGSNSWYLSPISFNGSASDSTSGLASFNCTLDGVALSSCSSITINDEGAHTLVFTAHDNAGNIRTLTQNVSLDTQNPTLNAGINGTLGSNNWFNTATLTATAADPTPGSGLFSFEYNFDKTNWITFPVSGTQNLPDGKHTIDIRAIDNAGRTISSSKTFWLDTVQPSVTVNSAGTLGVNNWYINNPSITAFASDDTSGIDLFEYSFDTNAWTPYITPLTLADGMHSISFWAQDQAGLVTQIDRTYQVDTRQPQIAGNISGVPGVNGWYVSNVTLSASASDPMPGSGLDAFTYTLNSSVETPYTTALSLADGQHTIQLTAQDQAGLKYSVEQNIKIDTVQPSLTISTALPVWIKNNIILSGTASDSGSGLSKLEISTDGGQTWQAVTGTASWNYDWGTQNSSDGSYNVHMRVTDKAGLATEQTMNVGVDNHAPRISLLDSWYQWNFVTLDIWDNFSGISEARVEISDPEGRWPKRVIRLDPQEFPLSFKWDRRFGDSTIAPLGTYDVKVTAFDNLGNMAHQSASIKILLDILPAGPTTTPQPYSRPEATPTAINTAAHVSSPAATPTVVLSVFGDIAPTMEVNSTPATQSIPRATPTQTNILDWLESIFVPDANSTEQVTEIQSSIFQLVESQTTNSQSNILWGAAAAAMIGATTAYVLEEKRKQKEEKERQAALEAKEAESHAKRRARKMTKLETKWAQERVWEEEQLRKEQVLSDSHNARMDVKMAGREAEDDAKWTASQAIMQKKAEEKELQAGLAAYYAAMRQGEKETGTAQSNWWENTKTFVKDEIFQPLDTYVYQPYIKPVVEKTNQIITDATAWTNENVYQPYIKPVVEKIQQAVTSTIAWTNENIYQPYIKPVVDKSIESLSSSISWVNDNVYQPYIQPALTTINEKIYQPYVEPFLNKAKDLIAAGSLWVNDNIYQPYIQPVVSDINEYIYEPIFKPVVDDISNWSENIWNKYGEWVHGALDTAGFIPGLGEIADGLNGLVYLGEGRYIEAGVSAMAMIPILGDLGKAGKWGLKLGSEVVEEVAEKLVKETVEELIEKTTQEMLEEVSEKILKESGEELLEKTTREVFDEVTEKTFKEIGEEIIEKVSQILPEKATKEVVGEVTIRAVKETGEVASVIATKDISKTVSERAVKEIMEQVGEETTQLISTLTEKYGEAAVNEFLPLCKKYDIDPFDILTRPPTEGQSLAGWVFGIENPLNPVNHSRVNLNLTDADLNNTLSESIKRPNSNIVVLGYGSGCTKPYYALSDEIEACHLSLSSDAWKPFEKARSNFWTDINAPFIEKSIEERKILLFNVKKEIVIDPLNVERFSLPELKLVELPKNNYVRIEFGDYDLFVPQELEESYLEYLPSKLIGEIK